MQLHQLVSITQGMATTGKGAGPRSGEWSLRIVDSGDIDGDAVSPDGLRSVDVERNARTEKHLLKPYDLLVTARSQTYQGSACAARRYANRGRRTLLVVRPFRRIPASPTIFGTS